MPVDPTAAARTQLASSDNGIAERLKSAARRGDDVGMEKAARAFEGYFVQTLLKEMREAADLGEGLFSGTEMETFSDLFDQEIAGRIAGRGLGLADMIVEGARRGAALSAYGPSAPETLPSGRDGFAWPLPSSTPGRVTSDFGGRVDPLAGEHRHHDGLDLAAPEGTPVLAVRGGVVRRAGDAGGYGNLVEIDHGDGVTTRYAHQAELRVAPGDRVEAGDVLGTVGSTGRSTGPHLHLEGRVDGEAVDPEAFLRGR